MQYIAYSKTFHIFDLSKRAAQLDKLRKRIMSTITAQQARDTKVFIINWCNKPEPIVEETTLYDHVMESAEETTSPRGVMTKLFVQEVEQEVEHGISNTYELRHWSPNGKFDIIGIYDSQEAADDERYARTYNYDFLPDDQRDTMYFTNREEAEAELKERIANQ